MKAKIKQWLCKKLEEWKNIRAIEHWEAHIKRNVPRNCFHCELLGICRNLEGDFKCRHGCLVLNAERKNKR